MSHLRVSCSVCGAHIKSHFQTMCVNVLVLLVLRGDASFKWLICKLTNIEYSASKKSILLVSVYSDGAM